MFHIIDIITAIYIGLNFPLILLEMILAIYLIIKGFDSDILRSVTEKE